MSIRSARHAALARRLLALLTALVAVPACGATAPDDGTGDDVFDDTAGDGDDDGGDDFPGFPDDDDDDGDDGIGDTPMGACIVDDVDTCSGDNVCVGDACVPAMGRSYTLSVSLQIAAEAPDGSSWDQPYGDPDGYVQLTMDDALVFEEYGTANVYQPTFNTRSKKTIAAGTTLVADGYDDDSLSDDELIISCTKEITAEDLRARQFSCTKEGSTITTRIVAE
jgi:hypothetical protein